MKYTVNNQATQNKELEYNEAFWSGKKTLTYNGKELKKIKRNHFEYTDGEKTEVFETKGNILTGIKVNMFGQDVEVLRTLIWYEVVLSLLLLIPGVIWGGLIGGGLAGLLTVTNLFIIRNLDKWYLKLIISLAFLIGEVVLLFVIGVLVLKIFDPII